MDYDDERSQEYEKECQIAESACIGTKISLANELADWIQNNLVITTKADFPIMFAHDKEAQKILNDVLEGRYGL